MTAEQQHDPPPEVAPPGWGMPDALVCFVVGFVTSQVGFAIAVGAGASNESIAATAVGLVGLWIGLIGSMLIVTRTKGSGRFDVDFGLLFDRGRDLGGVAIGVGTQLVVVPLIYLPFSRLIHDLNSRLEAPARGLTSQAESTTAIALLAVLVVIGAPVVEELFYRGLLLRSVQHRFGPNVAIGVSALVFGAAHGEPLQFPALVVFGVILGILATRTGRLGPGIFAHAGFNAVTIAVLIATR